MTSPFSIDQFHQKLRSLVDQKASGFDNSVPVFGTYGRKYFYGRITDHQFFLRRNSPFSRNSYRIDGSFTPGSDGNTEVTYELNYDKGSYWGIRLMPVLAWLLVDPFLYFNSDIPLEGILYINLFFSVGIIWIPVDIYRGKQMVKTFKEEFEIV